MRSLPLWAAVAVVLFSRTGIAEDAKVITTDALAAKMAGPPAGWGFTLVDARSRVEYAESHIPGAVLVPARLVGARLPELVKDRNRLVVFYCNGPNCTKTVKAAKAAAAAGYTNIAEYKEGLPGWGKAGRDTEGKPLPSVEVARIAPAALAQGLASSAPPFVMDVRDPEEFAAFRIAGSVSMPLDDIATRLTEVPAGRPIVLVDHAGHQTPVAARVLASLGRKDVRRLDGGILRWQAEGKQVSR